ncbi:MAG: DUF5685 family protein [Firmicutes bacterium]|nr:DUF5685 family protein [Bacillota bacterium]
MFGYVKPLTSELRLREEEFYRSVYCGLCRSMKALTGRVSTLTLSYDMVFLVLTRLSISGEHYGTELCRCGVNPLRLERRPIMNDGGELRYAAGVSSLLTECKIADDANDERGLSRTGAKLSLGGAERRTVRSGVPAQLESAVKSRLSELYEKEAQKPESVDMCASVFGELLGDIFAFGIDDKAGAAIAREIGRGAGRFIYIADAADDVGEDIKAGRWNPVAALWKDEIHGDVFSDFAKEAILSSVKLELSRAAGAAELIELPEGGYPETLEIVKNILYLGMPDAAKRILYGDGGKKSKKHKRTGAEDFEGSL